jgi:hypothetical protein
MYLGSEKVGWLIEKTAVSVDARGSRQLGRNARFELEFHFLAAKNKAEIMFPKLPREPHSGKPMVKVHQKFDACRAPQIQKLDPAADDPKIYIGIKTEVPLFGHERVKRV